MASKNLRRAPRRGEGKLADAAAEVERWRELALSTDLAAARLS